MKALLQTALVMGASWSALAAGPGLAELERKAAQGEDLGPLIESMGGALVDESMMTADELAWLRHKQDGTTPSARLTRRLFPHLGETLLPPDRDGGDDAESATVIADVDFGTTYSDTGTTADKTNVLPSPQTAPASCDFGIYTGSFSAPDAWYTFTLTEATFVSATTCLAGTLYDTCFGILDADLALVAADDDETCTPSFRSTLECNLSAGQYYLVVDGYNATSFGDYELEIQFNESPCVTYESLIEAVDAPATITGDTGDGANVYAGLGGDLGFDVTIPSDGLWDLDACQAGTAYAADLYLLDASPCDGGTLLFSSTTSNCATPAGAGRLLALDLTAGTYHLVVSHTAALTGAFEVVVQETPDAPTQGGPDALGYTWISSRDAAGPDYVFEDISTTGVDLAINGDDTSGPVTLPFAFPYYEATYTSATVGSNGYLVFSGPATTFVNTALPTATTPNNGIYGFWDDLTTSAATAQIFFLDDSANGRAIIQWNDVPQLSGAADINTFQIVLHEDGAFEIVFDDLAENDIASASVGTENVDGTIGLQVNVNGEGAIIGDGTLFSFIPQEGDFRPPLISLLTVPGTVEGELPGDHMVEAEITDETGVADATIFYSVNGGAEASAAMSDQGDDVWAGGIPHQDQGSTVVFRIEATDSGENSVVGTSADYAFTVVSYVWPPLGLAATDGLLDYTRVTWLAPVDPDALAEWFDGDAPSSDDEALARLTARGLSKDAAWTTWQGILATARADRSFEGYNVYRDDELIGTTTNLVFDDVPGLGAEPNVVYEYYVTAQFTAGESDPSNVDEGLRGTRPTHGGPDEFGYTWANSQDPNGPEHVFEDISATGVDLAINGDDTSGPVTLPFDFPYYEDTYATATVSSNGYLVFSGTATSYTNTVLPAVGIPNAGIYPFWDDLTTSAATAQIFYLDDGGNGRAIIQWNDVPQLSGAADINTFQIVLHDDGTFEVVYDDMAENDVVGASVGTENIDGTIGLQVNYNGEGGFVGDATTIAFAPIPGDFQPPQIVHAVPLQTIETELEDDWTVDATITDASGIDAAEIVYTVNGGAAQTAPMTNGAGDAWSGVLPHQAAGTTVAYHIEATDLSENGNTRVSPTWTFDVVSYHWPPMGLVASDGNLSQTNITWFAPVNPGLLAEVFGDARPATLDEALAILMAGGRSKAEAFAVWTDLTARDEAGRAFIEYNVYRDDELIGNTTALSWIDNLDGGSEADVVYDYSVTAQFDAGESEPSNTDSGVWGSPPTWGGPDAFGYTWLHTNNASGPAYEWTDISEDPNAVAVSPLGDDTFVSGIEMGIDFPFYGEIQNTINVAMNGFVNFGTGNGSLSNQQFPNATAPNGTIALFWDDLDPGDGVGTIHTLSDPENNRFIVQYTGVPDYPGPSGLPNTFQAILYESGVVRINWEDLQGDRTSATVGVENLDGTIGLTANYNNEGCELIGQRSIVFMPPSSCEPLDCVGDDETEPNGGWDDDNASYEVIRCGETWCGTVQDDGTTVDRDWYRYTHFGGDVVFSLEASDFDPRLSLVEFEVGGATVATANVFPRCFNETLAVSGLASGTYFLVVEHDGDPDVTEPQTYSLSLECTGDPCAGHEPITCDGTPETEPNEGWNDDNASYGEIAFGETVCGTVWATDGARDFDWFRFELDLAADVDIHLDVDAFDAALFVTEFDPAGSVLHDVDLAPPCHPEDLSIVGLAPGEYFVVVSHNDVEGVPDPQSYALTLTLSIPAEGMCDNYIDGGTLGQEWYTVERPAPGFTHHNGTGCPGAVSSPGRDEVHRLVLAPQTSVGVTLHGDGDADEVILLVGDCANPASSCGAAANAVGAGPSAETMSAPGLPAGDYFIVADFAGAGESHPYTITVRDLNSAIGADGLPLSFELAGNFPNPFNPTTTVRWTQPELLPAELVVHNILGEEVARVNLGFRGPGQQSFRWDASQLGSGVYVYTLRSGPHSATMKALLIK